MTHADGASPLSGTDGPEPLLRLRRLRVRLGRRAAALPGQRVRRRVAHQSPRPRGVPSNGAVVASPPRGGRGRLRVRGGRPLEEHGVGSPRRSRDPRREPRRRRRERALGTRSAESDRRSDCDRSHRLSGAAETRPRRILRPDARRPGNGRGRRRRRRAPAEPGPLRRLALPAGPPPRRGRASLGEAGLRPEGLATGRRPEGLGRIRRRDGRLRGHRLVRALSAGRPPRPGCVAAAALRPREPPRDGLDRWKAGGREPDGLSALRNPGVAVARARARRVDRRARRERHALRLVARNGDGRVGAVRRPPRAGRAPDDGAGLRPRRRDPRGAPKGWRRGRGAGRRRDREHGG